MPFLLRWQFAFVAAVFATAITSFSAPINNFAISEARAGTSPNHLPNQNMNIEEHSQSTHAAFQDHSNQVQSFNHPEVKNLVKDSSDPNALLHVNHQPSLNEAADKDILQKTNSAELRGRTKEFPINWSFYSDLSPMTPYHLSDALEHDLDHCIQKNDYSGLENIIREENINADYVIERAMLNRNIQVIKDFAGKAKDLELRQKYVQLAEETNDWSLLENLDLKGVQVSHIISKLLPTEDTDLSYSYLLKRVLDEGIYEAQDLRSDPKVFVVKYAPLMTIDGQMKIHFDSSMKDKKPEIVAEWVRLDLVDVKEVLQLSTEDQDFYNALVQNPIIQRRLIMNNDLETIRSLIKEESVHTKDILEEANEWENLYVSSSLAKPKKLKKTLLKRVNSGKWKEIMQMNLKNVDINDLLHPKVISKLEGEPRVLRYLLSQGSFSLRKVLKAKNSLKPDSALIAYLESAVDKSLSEIIFKKDINKLSSLVEGKKIKLDRIMDLADEAMLKSLVKLQAIQDSLFTSDDFDNIRLLASKDVLTVQEVLNLAQLYGDEGLKNEFEIYQKNRIPIKVSLPKTILHGEYKPVTRLTNGEWPLFDPENYPQVELKGKMLKPVKILGQGVDGQVVSYQNEQDPSEFIAVKIGLLKKPNYRLQNPQREELHLAKKANLIKGKTATLDGYSFTPMKLIRGEPYANIVYSEEFQRPDELVQQINAVDKAIEDMSKLGVEHRDLHLNNIMYDPITSKATIIDFGRSASSSVTDASGQKFQLNPYADRKRFLLDMEKIRVLIKTENAKLRRRFNYDPVKTLIAEKLELAAGAEAVSTANPRKEYSTKQAIFNNLVEQHNVLAAKSEKTEQNWRDLVRMNKQMKHLIREMGTLSHEHTLSNLGAKHNPREMQKMYDALEQGKVNQQHYTNAKHILEVNRQFNSKLARVHELFQLAKSNLKQISETKRSLPEESSDKITEFSRSLPEESSDMITESSQSLPKESSDMITEFSESKRSLPEESSDKITEPESSDGLTQSDDSTQHPSKKRKFNS